MVLIDKASKEDLSQISLTGIRSLVLLGLLAKAPRSLKEIRDAFIKYNIMDEDNSDDILRIDINTLKSMGCEISRADHRTNNKYVLLNHPFKINFSKEEVSVLKRIFNKIKEDADVSLIMQYDELFSKIALHVSDNEIKELLLGISPLKGYKADILNELKIACEKKNLVCLLYKIPETGKEEEKNIVAEKTVLQHNKFYLYGIDKDTGRSVYLNVKRIIEIISQNSNNEIIHKEPVVVKYHLKKFGISGLEENEMILSGDVPEGFIIEGRYHNEFLAIQRVLSLGSDCTVIEPEDFQKKIVNILKKMREIYNG